MTLRCLCFPAFVRRRFRYACLASLFAALLLLAAVAWLAINHVLWWQAWQSNYHAFMHGGSGDPMAGNSSRYQLINLQYPLHCFLRSRMLVTAVTLSFVGAMGLAAVVALHKLTGPRAELLGLSIFAVLGLLPFYHRYYDGLLLAFRQGIYYTAKFHIISLMNFLTMRIPANPSQTNNAAFQDCHYWFLPFAYFISISRFARADSSIASKTLIGIRSCSSEKGRVLVLISSIKLLKLLS